MLQNSNILDPKFKINKIQINKSVDTSGLSSDPFDKVVAVKEEEDEYEDYQVSIYLIF